MQRDPSHPHINALLAGAATGAYSLPSDVTSAASVLDHLHAYGQELRKAAPPLSAVALAEQLGDELVDAVARGGAGIPPAFLDRVERTEREHHRITYATTMVSAAEERAWARLWSAVVDADAIITEHLRPALESTLAVVRAAAPKLRDADVTNADAIVDAPRATQDAYTALRAASARYGAIRTAQRHVYAISGAPQSGDRFTETENLRELYGNRWMSQHLSSWRPAPEHPLRRLLWLATSDARPWMPTASEADAVAQRVRDEFAPRGRETVGVYSA